MDDVTIALGKSLRNFQEKTCSAYDTQELLREAGARKKRQAKAAAPQSSETVQDMNSVPGEPPNASTSNLTMGTEQNSAGPTKPATKKRKHATKAPRTVVKDSDKILRLKKSLNLNTYKNHSLGDYTEAIRRYGTTDSYSTESVFVNLFLRRY